MEQSNTTGAATMTTFTTPSGNVYTNTKPLTDDQKRQKMARYYDVSRVLEFGYNESADECQACQVDSFVDRFGWDGVSDDDKARWSMWGCTCTTEAAEEAQAFMNLVTR